MKFLTSYKHARKAWSLIIDAENWRDAEKRCKALNLKLDGELIAEIPAWLPMTETIVRLTCWVRNFIIRRRQNAAVKNLLEAVERIS